VLLPVFQLGVRISPLRRQLGCHNPGAEHPAKGEMTLVIGPAEKGAAGANIDTAQSLAARVEALKLAAKERGMTKRDA
jgi:hypothetical protein